MVKQETNHNCTVLVKMVLMFLILTAGSLAAFSKGIQSELSLKAVDLPDTPAGKCADAYFKAFNSGDDNQMESFMNRYRSKSDLKRLPVKDWIKSENKLRDLWETLIPKRVALSREEQITILVFSTSLHDEVLVFRFKLREEIPPKITSLIRRGISVRPEDALNASDNDIISTADRGERIDTTIRSSTIQGIAKSLKEIYVYPETGRKMADTLIYYHSEGRYNSLKNAGQLADKITKDAQKVSGDLHIWVEASNPHAPSMYEYKRDIGELRRENYGWRKVEILDGNIGYIKFDKFFEGKEAEQTTAAALAFVAHCDALIFDLRDNSGGKGMSRLIKSYFFRKPTIFGYIYDRNGKRLPAEPTFKNIPGKRFADDLPLYILTSKRTGSAPESFAYDMKNSKRAVIVGEITKGMAHASLEKVINDNFRISIPFLRGENLITKTNWEGVGVIPNIQVAADKALETAYRDAKAKMRKNQ